MLGPRFGLGLAYLPKSKLSTKVLAENIVLKDQFNKNLLKLLK